MPIDLVTLMEFEDGNMTQKEIAAMLSEMLESGEINTLPNKFSKLANKYKKAGLLSGKELEDE